MVPVNVIARVLGVPAPIQALLTVTLILPFAAPQAKIHQDGIRSLT